MKIILATALATFTLTAPVFAEATAEELFAMSNDSAAETIVREHSTGDVTAVQIKLALENMSSAERKSFFGQGHVERMEILNCMHAGDSGDSAAESCAIK